MLSRKLWQFWNENSNISNFPGLEDANIYGENEYEQANVITRKDGNTIRGSNFVDEEEEYDDDGVDAEAESYFPNDG